MDKVFRNLAVSLLVALGLASPTMGVANEKAFNNDIGVFIQRLTPENRDSLGAPMMAGGVLVSSIKEGTIGSNKLAPGDILVEISGFKIKELMDVPLYLSRSSLGEPIDILIYRHTSGSFLKIEATPNIVEVAPSVVFNILQELSDEELCEATSTGDGWSRWLSLLERLQTHRNASCVSNKTQVAEGPNEVAPSVSNKNPSINPKEVVMASSGSGFAVSKDGHVITNHHVINGCQKVFLYHEGEKISVKVITFDQQNDLALLKGDFVPKTVFPIRINKPELLQDIYVAGFPFGVNFSTGVKVTKGIVSSLTGVANNFSEIQIDAAIQSGNSGGPILDDDGNLMGVAVAKLDVKFMIENFGSIPENTNFGIKASVVESVLDSSGVKYLPPNQGPISKSELGERIINGTYYISCWMTIAQIELMKTKKVMFSELD